MVPPDVPAVLVGGQTSVVHVASFVVRATKAEQVELHDQVEEGRVAFAFFFIVRRRRLQQGFRGFEGYQKGIEAHLVVGAKVKDGR